MCDGIDHCGDQSDESPALDCSMSGMLAIMIMMMLPVRYGCSDDDDDDDDDGDGDGKDDDPCQIWLY